MASVALLLAAAAALPAELGPGWAEFSRNPALRREKVTVQIGTLGFDRNRRQLDFWLRRTVTRFGNNVTIAWAESRTCPAVRPALSSMRDLPVARFAPPGFSPDKPIIMDGVGYSLRSYSDDGQLTASTNIGTPLAAWVDRTIAALEPCWTQTVPRRTPR